jgi:hypothetical protein
MKRAVLALVLMVVVAPVLAYPEDITLFKHAYRKQAQPPPPPPPPKDAQKYARYRVKPGDTLRKIFLKDFGVKPEDLPALYRKFRQYNPNVTDLDRIASDYSLTIPSHGRVQVQAERKASPRQAQSGTVIVIKKGQHLAKVLREMYGLTNDTIFHDYIEKIRKLNPDIEDLNLLVEGQKVKLPPMGAAPRQVVQEPAPQDKPKAAAVGGPKRLRIVELKESAAGQNGGAASKGNGSQAAAAPGAGQPPTQAVTPTEDAAAAERAREQETRERQAVEYVQGSLLPAFKGMGASQHDHGTYYLPVMGDKIVAINTSDIPIIDLDLGRRIIVDVNNKIAPQTKKLIEESYPATKVVSGPLGDRENLMERLLDACGYFSVNKDAGPVLVGEDEKIRLFGRWVVYKDRMRRNVIVINSLTDDEYPIPQEIRDYVARFGIRLVEMGGKGAAPRKAVPAGIKGLGQSYEKLFGIMRVSWEKDKVLGLVSLDSMKISYTAPMLVGKTIITSEMPDKTMLDMLQKSGYRVMDAKADDLGSILDAIGQQKMGPPVRFVIAKGRAELDLPAVQVGDTIILEHQVDKDIVKYLTSSGVKASIW